MKKYYNRISLWSRIVNSSFKLTGYKKKSETVNAAKEYIKELEKKYEKYNLPEEMGLKKIEFEGMKVYSYNDKPKSKKILLYIHGGSYVEEANYFQIDFAMKVAKKTNSILIFPRYPLAPQGNYKIMYSLIEKLYTKLLERNLEINFLGDSAGGGFILSFAMYLRDIQKRLPKNIIMMSPWLDISMTNPKIYEDAKIDNMCGVDGTRYEGTLWADNLDPKNPLVSPIYGNFNNLSDMTIIVGGKEILTSECSEFSDMLDNLNIKHNYIEYKNQGHVFGMYPTREGKMVLKDICSILNKD